MGELEASHEQRCLEHRADERGGSRYIRYSPRKYRANLGGGRRRRRRGCSGSDGNSGVLLYQICIGTVTGESRLRHQLLVIYHTLIHSYTLTHTQSLSLSLSTSSLAPKIQTRESRYCNLIFNRVRSIEIKGIVRMLASFTLFIYSLFMFRA